MRALLLTSVLCNATQRVYAEVCACRGRRRAVERRERAAERTALLARVQTRHAQRAARAARDRVRLARVERQVGERVGERRARSARQLVGHPPAQRMAGPLDAELHSTMSNNERAALTNPPRDPRRPDTAGPPALRHTTPPTASTTPQARIAFASLLLFKYSYE